jgi:hypothetical protein
MSGWVGASRGFVDDTVLVIEQVLQETPPLPVFTYLRGKAGGRTEGNLKFLDFWAFVNPKQAGDLRHGTPRL